METIQTKIIKVTCLTVQKWDTSEAESLWPDLQATDVKVRLTLQPGSIATDHSQAADGNEMGSSQIYTVSMKCRCFWHLENYVRFYNLHMPPLVTRWTNACRRLCIEVRQCTTYNNHLQEICDLGNKKPMIRINHDVSLQLKEQLRCPSNSKHDQKAGMLMYDRYEEILSPYPGSFSASLGQTRSEITVCLAAGR